MRKIKPIKMEGHDSRGHVLENFWNINIVQRQTLQVLKSNFTALRG